MKKWKCLICGEIVESETRPESCPLCKAPGEKFEEIVEIARMMFFSFILLLIPSMIISYITYWFRYRKSKKKIIEHRNDLLALRKFYEQESKSDSEKDAE